MPELPEVEVTRRRIGPLLIGRRICEVRTTRDSRLFLTRPARLRARLRGRCVAAVGRRGKYLVAEFDDGARLVVHLGMTGQLFSSAATSPRLLSASRRTSLAPEAQGDFRPDAHTHLQLRFEDGGPEVFLRDVRKFGKLLLLERGESHPRLARLGLDALETTGDALFAATRGRTASIKALLLDQALISGVGNIYADEALFRAGRTPASASGSPRRSARCSSARSRPAARASATMSLPTGATASIRTSAASTRAGASPACVAAARSGAPPSRSAARTIVRSARPEANREPKC